MTTWKDVTSYGGGTGPKVPTTWELISGHLRVVVTRHIHYDPEAWVLRCPAVGIDLQELKEPDLEDAQREAIRLVYVRIENLVADVSEIIDVTPPDESVDPPPGALKLLSDNPLLRLHDPRSGRIDAKRVARAYGLSLRALSKALGRKPQTVGKTPTSSSLQNQLAHFRRSYELLLKLLGDQAKVLAWLNAPQPDLAGEQPIALFSRGEAETVRNFLEVMYAGGPL